MGEESVVVTGGAGMIGSALVKRLVMDGHCVHVADNLWRGRKENLLWPDGSPVIDLHSNLHCIDLAKPSALQPLLERADHVFHLADVVAGVGYVFRHQLEIFHNNLLINTNVIASVAECPWIKGFIYTGTACSFPSEIQTGVDAAPMREEDQYPANPESAYGWSKLMGEYEASLLQSEVNIPVGILVLHNVYGAQCDLDPERSQVIPALVRRVIEYPDQPLTVWGSGNQGRAFIHVEDVVDALILCKRRGLGVGPIQIGPNICTSIGDMARLLVDISGASVSIRFDRSKPEGDLGRCADFSKAREVLGWSPRIDLQTGLSDVYRWAASKLTGEGDR